MPRLQLPHRRQPRMCKYLITGAKYYLGLINKQKSCEWQRWCRQVRKSGLNAQVCHFTGCVASVLFLPFFYESESCCRKWLAEFSDPVLCICKFYKWDLSWLRHILYNFRLANWASVSPRAFRAFAYIFASFFLNLWMRLAPSLNI